jgi:hypothetical protein
LSIFDPSSSQTQGRIMSLHSPACPSRLSLFVFDPENGQPVSHLPIYAEVVVPRIVPPLPHSSAFQELISSVLGDFGLPNRNSVRDRVVAAAEQAFVDVIATSWSSLKQSKLRRLFQEVFKEVLQVTGTERIEDVRPSELKQRIVNALRNQAAEFGLEVVPEQVPATSIWAEPLGVLATDHVGYVSFDLTRLNPGVATQLIAAIDTRRNDPDAKLPVAIWVYPYGHAARIDALSQGRFAFDAVVGRLEAKASALPRSLSDIGPRALQNPSLTDWWLSPASFAANPNALVGSDGCEELVPANLALQEFGLRQVVRITDPPTEMNVPEPYRAAYVRASAH